MHDYTLQLTVQNVYPANDVGICCKLIYQISNTTKSISIFNEAIHVEF